MNKRVIISWLMMAAILLPACSNARSSTHGQQARVEDAQPVTVAVPEKPKMQVVFLLDATGSMSGLIGAAKEKIWSIAGGLTQTEPTPEIEIGMIFYRDRGDEFITRHIPLGSGMDDLYEQLMAMSAAGGGDEPESVNRALYEGVTKMQWDTLPKTYRAIFLVGDCPPHMDYRNDVKYPESCAQANGRNIIINTVLMGNNSNAGKIWREIARSTNGEFIQTDMSVNNITVSTPFDKKINDLQYELDNNRVYYGSSKKLAVQKKEQSEKIKSSDAAINARRSGYNLSKAGKESYYGSHELVNDVMNGKKLSDVAQADLPKELQGMPESELRSYVDHLIAQRKKLEEEISQLNRQRQQYIEAELEKMDRVRVENSFDDVIFKAVQEQAESKDIKIEGKAKR